MAWHDVGILYLKELRTAFRERSIVVNSVLLPVFLYPVLLWLAFTGISFVEGLAEGFTSRVVVLEPPGGHGALLDSLGSTDGVEILDTPASVQEATRLVREGDADAVLEFTPPREEDGALSGNFGARIHYDRSVERSRRALARVEGVIDDYRDRWLVREAGTLGISERERVGFGIVRRDVASERDRGATLLSEMIPLFIVVMVALGCFMPAIDTTAGERERSTWETTLTLAAPRSAVVTAKYLSVATLGVLAGALNVAALMISVGAVFEPVLGRAGTEFAFSIPLLATPVLILGAAALALFFGAAMMLLASFARTFKDGQAMVTPVYWLVFIPFLMGGGSSQHLTPTRALVPILNVAQMMKDAVLGVFLWPLVAETLAVTAAIVVFLLFLSRQVLRFEDFLVGSHDGSFWRFAKEKLAR